MPGAVRPGYRRRTAGVDFAVSAYHKVITYVGKAARKVHLSYLLHGVVLTLRRGCAVQNDFIDLALAMGYSQSRPRLRPGNTVGFQPLALLKLFYRFLGQGSEYAVGHQV